MSKRKKIVSIISGCVLLVVILIVSVYFISGGYTQLMVVYETNHMISHQDHSEMAKVAANHKTYQYLSGLSKHTKLDYTPDFQGGTPTSNYYVTGIHNRTLGVTINKQSTFKWRIESIEVY